MHCPTEEEILVFVEGRAGTHELPRVAEHLAGCKSCADLVAAAAGGAPSAHTAAAVLAAETETLPRGTNVGRYVILNLVGRGGMGEVYAAYDPQLDRRIALKLLHQTGLGDGERVARERLLREAKAIARLSHPNVVVVHDAGAISDPTQRERVFLAMEFIEGRTLADWLADPSRTWRQVRDVFIAAGAGLLAAHDAGLVHRDFKPQNVMVGADGTVRVMDFGLASDGAEIAEGAIDLDGIAPDVGAKSMALTRTGVLLGTPLYMAPEQFLAHRTDARTDQFSFCVALYEALYGERPFPSQTLPALIDAVTHGEVRAAPARSRVPPFLRRIIVRGLQPDPSNRFPSMRELLDQLRIDPGRRQRIGAGVTLAVALVAGLAAGAHRLATRNQRVCLGAADRLGGAWEMEPAGPRRDGVQRAFMATGVRYAAESWVRVAGVLDDYARRWIGLYTDSCQATHARGDQSAEVMDLRMACLDSNRGALAALVDVLSRADAGVVREAVSSAQSLPPLDRCSDVAALRAAVPPPSNAADRETLNRLRRQLDEVKALTDTAQLEAASKREAGLVDGARRLGYAPLLAEVFRQDAWLQMNVDGPAKAAERFEASVWAALEGRRDDIAIESASFAMGITGYHLGQADASNRWQSLCWALLKRVGPGHDRQLAYFYHWRGVARQRTADLRAALDDSLKAVELTKRVTSPDSLETVDLLSAIASIQIDSGNYASAVDFTNQAVDAVRRCCGEQNPRIGLPLAARGEALARAGRLVEGERDLRRSIDLFNETGGVWLVWSSYPMTALGKDLIDQHRPAEAARTLERALAIREKNEPNPEMVAETRFALARALWDEGAQPARALLIAEQARSAYGKIPQRAADAAEVTRWMTGKKL